MHAIEAALEKLRGSLGTDVVDQAVASAGLPAAGYSAAELEWLASWCESHDAPETITAEVADDALKKRRSEMGGSSAVAVLQEAQLLEAQRRAAEKTLERASRRLAALPDAHADKRQRAEPPAWAGREYASYDTVEYWRQEEMCVPSVKRGKETDENSYETPKIFAPAAGFCLRRRLRRASQNPVSTSTGSPCPEPEPRLLLRRAKLSAARAHNHSPEHAAPLTGPSSSRRA